MKCLHTQTAFVTGGMLFALATNGEYAVDTYNKAVTLDKFIAEMTMIVAGTIRGCAN